MEDIENAKAIKKVLYIYIFYKLTVCFMKKKFILLVSLAFLFLLFENLHAQGFSYQFYGGGNINFQTVKYNFGVRGIDTSFFTDSKYALNFGFAARYDFPKIFGIRLEAQYSKKSGKIVSNKVGAIPGFTAVQRTYSSSYDYIQFGLLPQLNLPVITKSKIYLNAGPYFSFAFSSTESIVEETLLQSRSYSKDLSNDTKSYDAGLIFGLGIEYTEAPYIGFTAGIRYVMGLQNILDTPDKDKVSIKNNSINLNLGIILK